MTQFVRKTLLGGFAEVPGGQNDPECSHVLMDQEEYDRLLRYISEKEWAVTQARNEGDNALAMANRSAREALAQAEKEAEERLQALRQELEAEKDESAYQRALNAKPAADQPRARQRGARTEAEKDEAGVHRTLFGGKGLSVSGRKEAH